VDPAGIALGVATLVGGALVYRYLFRRDGREYREALNQVYVRDPDELGAPPAVCGYVARLYRLRGDDLAATAVDLIARGVIGSRDDEGVPTVTKSLLVLHREHAVGLWPHEIAVLCLLFAPCGEVCPLAGLDMLHQRGWHDRKVYSARIDDFARCVRDEVDALGLGVEPYGMDAVVRVVTLGSVVVALSLCASLLAHHWVFMIAGIALAIAAAVSDNVMFRRTRNGRILQLRCQALRRYWHDFGRLQEKDVDSVVLWGRHLAYATALGDAHLALSELRRGDDRLGRLAETLSIDDQSWVESGDFVSDIEIEGWITILGLPAESGGSRFGPAPSGRA
jgi:hypothetical protein